MATDSKTVLVATPQSEMAATNTNDPFVDHSAPRHNRGSLEALVAAIQQVYFSTMATRSPLVHATSRLERFIVRFLHFMPSPDAPVRGFSRTFHRKSSYLKRNILCLHTLTGRATSAATNDGLQTEERQSKHPAASRAMHPHHHESTARRQRLPNVRQNP
jgi:hypothetical protein